MSAEEFWKDDPQLFVSYRTFYMNKKQREMEEADYLCWLQGEYIHEGNGILTSALIKTLKNMFGGKKDNGVLPTYTEKPYLLRSKEKQEQENKNRKEIEKKEKYEKFQQTLMYAGTMKKRYLESIKNKDKLK